MGVWVCGCGCPVGKRKKKKKKKTQDWREGTGGWGCGPCREEKKKKEEDTTYNKLRTRGCRNMNKTQNLRGMTFMIA